MAVNYGLQDNTIFDPSTGVQTISQGIIDWCKEQHFYNDFSGIFIAVIAMLLFSLFWLWKFACENHKPLIDSVGEERAEKIAHILSLSAYLCLAGFLAWYFFVFRTNYMSGSDAVASLP